MSPIAALFVAVVLTAGGVSCEGPYFNRNVDFIDVDALVDGVHSKANAEWFEKNAQSPHGLDCSASCRGFGGKGDCKGLHTLKCSGVETGEKATIHSRMLVTCLGAYRFGQNITDDGLDMASGCHGLFASHTFTAVTKNITTLPENCHGHCSKHHKGSHCSEHCPEKGHHSSFDAVVKSEAACGLTHSWSLAHPFSKGSTISTHSTCSGVSSFSMSFYGKKEIPADEDMEAVFEQESALYETMDSSTILGKLSNIVAMSTSGAKESDMLNTLDSVDIFSSAKMETIDVTCNGKPAPVEADCEGEYEVKRTGNDKHRGVFVEDDVCKGKEAFLHNTFVCQGTLTSDRTDTAESGEVKATQSVCEGKHLFSMVTKDMEGASISGFGTVCVGDGVYDTSTTPPAEGESTEEASTPKDEPVSEPEATPKTAEAPVSEPEVTPKTAEAPIAAPTQESAAKPIRKPIHVKLFENNKMSFV